MSKEFKAITSIGDFNNGAIDEIVKDALPKVLKNLADENTKWNVERGIDVKIRMKITDETRETMVTTVEVLPKLAPPKPHEAVAHLSFNGLQVEAISVKDTQQKELPNISEFPNEKEA